CTRRGVTGLLLPSQALTALLTRIEPRLAPAVHKLLRTGRPPSRKAANSSRDEDAKPRVRQNLTAGLPKEGWSSPSSTVVFLQGRSRNVRMAVAPRSGSGSVHGIRVDERGEGRSAGRIMDCSHDQRRWEHPDRPRVLSGLLLHLGHAVSRRDVLLGRFLDQHATPDANRRLPADRSRDG